MMRGERERWSGWAADLASPWPLVAVAVLAVNDHVAKLSPVVPRWLTGKASDLAGLFFFPLLAVALADAASRLALRRALTHRVRATAHAALLTGLAFAAIKLDEPSRRLAERLLGPIAPDASDLVALPMLALSILFAARALPRELPWPAWVRASAVLFAALASLATSAPRMTRPYPVWSIEADADRALSCGSIHAWFSKSGKEGAGLSLFVYTDQAECTVHVVEATLQIAGGPSVRGEPANGVVARKNAPATAYVPFVFDEESAWNDGLREGRVAVRVATDAGEIAWSMPATHRYLRAFGPEPAAPPPPPSALPAAAPSGAGGVSE